MQVVISTSPLPFEVVVSCPVPDGVTVVEALPTIVTVTTFRDGVNGLSAYQIAVNNGFVGTEPEWLSFLEGIDGLSAYDIAVLNGFVGTVPEWLLSLRGPRGDDGVNNTLEMVRAENNIIEGDINADGNTITNVREAVDGSEVVNLQQMIANDQQTLLDAKSYTDENVQNETLEVVRSRDNNIYGNIGANNNTIKDLANAIDPQDPATLNQLDAALQEAKNYADTVSTNTVRWAGYWDASVGTFPATSGIRRGDEYEISVAGTINTIVLEVGDLIRARINSPGQVAGNWSASQGNTQQATETVQGTMKIAAGTTVADTTSLNDSDAVTTKKLWLNFVPSFLLTNWVWDALQTFNVSPRLNTLSPNQYLKSNETKEIITVSSIPATDIGTDTTHRWWTDALATILIGKQNAIGYTPENAINKKSTITASATDYPNGQAVTNALALKQDKGNYRQLIAVNAGNTTHTGTISETVVSSITIGANSLDALCDLFFSYDYGKNSSNANTIKVYLNTSNTLTGATLIASYTSGSNRNGGFFRKMILRGTNLDTQASTASLLVNWPGDILFAATNVVTLNPAINNYILVTIALTNTSDIVTSKRTTLEKLNLTI